MNDEGINFDEEDDIMELGNQQQQQQQQQQQPRQQARREPYWNKSEMDGMTGMRVICGPDKSQKAQE